MKKEEKNENMFFSLVDTNNTVTENLIEWDRISTNKWVNWGLDNKAPLVLWENYKKNSLLASIVNRITDYVFGAGVDVKGSMPISDNEDSFSDLVRKCVFDYVLFGGFSVECIRNSFGKIVRYNYQNVMNVRVNEDLNTAYISSKWNSYSTSKYVTLPLYDKNNNEQAHFLMYYRGPITRGINPIPSYASALKSIEILNNTRNFHLNNLRNGFSASAIINLNNENIKTRELQEIKDKLKEGYSGTNNAGNFLLLNGGSKDHAATVVRLAADNFGDLYQSLDDSSKEDIYTAFAMNPILLGKNVSTGFSKEEFASAYALYYSTYIKPIQDTIQLQFNKIDVSFAWQHIIIDFPK